MKKLITLFLLSLSILSCTMEDEPPEPHTAFQGVELYNSATEFVYEKDGKIFITRFEKSTNKIYQTVESDGVKDELNVKGTHVYQNYHGSVYDYVLYYTDRLKDPVTYSPVVTVVIAHNTKTDAYYLTTSYSNEKFDYNPAIYVEVTRTK